MNKIGLFLLTAIMSFNTFAQNDLFGNKNTGLFGNISDPLSAEEAFEPDYHIKDNNLKINFIIQPKHYLYNHKLKLSINEKVVDFEVSNKTPKEDAHYGKIEAVYDFLNINKTIEEPIEKFKFEYQGCSEEFNICYPMQSIEHIIPEKKTLNKILGVETISTPTNFKKEIVTPILDNERNKFKTKTPISEEVVINPIIPTPEIIKEKIPETSNNVNKVEEVAINPIIPTPEIIKKEIPEKKESSKVEQKKINKENEVEKSVDLNKQNNLEIQEGFLSEYINEKSLTEALSDKEFIVTIGLFFLAGILISFTPCVLPMIPIISSIVVGSNKEETKSFKAFLLAFSYVLGSSLTYAILGALTAYFSTNIQIYMQNPYIISIFSILLVVFALSLFGLFEIKLPQKLTNKSTEYSNKLSGGKIFSVFLMGMLSTLIVSPCVAAPLAAAITYISTTSDVLLGAFSLFSFGLGIGLVLIIITTLLNKVSLTNGILMTEVKYLSGTLIILVAVYLMERVLYPEITTYLYQILVISYLINIYARNYSKLKHLFIFIILTLCAIIYINDKQEINNLFIEKNSSNIVEEVIVNELNYTNLNSIEDIKIKNKYALIKVTADWCTYCKKMEKEIFKNPEFISMLSDYQLFILDVTEVTKEEQVILNQMKVQAPPALFFFKDKEMIHKENRGVEKERMKEILNKIK